MKRTTMLLLAAAVAVSACHKDIRSAISSSAYSTRSDVTVTSSYIVLTNYAYTWDSSGSKRSLRNIRVNLDPMPGADKMSVVVVDKNGKVFDAEKGEVLSRDAGIKSPEDKLDPTAINAGKFSYDYSGRASYYSPLSDIPIEEMKSRNSFYYKIPGNLTQEGKDVYIGFSIYLPKRGAYQIVLVAPASHV